MTYFETKKTLFLYKKLENIIYFTQIIKNKYKNNFMKKILTLSNNGIEKIILYNNL